MDKAVLGSPRNFIEEIIEEEILKGKHDSIVTRFPPEPNGYLHIGHCKAIVVDFGIAEKYQGQCNLRFDDTNPVKEETEFVDNIMEDLHWLGYDWGSGLYYASDYFDKLYLYAEQLIEKGLAYVCDLSPEDMREYRGTLTEPGKNSPYRERSIKENLALFRDMRDGKFKEGEKTLRAKINMSSPNLNMRDPVMYRILFAEHHRTKNKWCIYPMYDWAHPVSDAIEGVTHSTCSLEYEDHRPLYDWFVNALGFANPPRQIEFSRLNMTGTVMSKRHLRKLVEEKIVSGWDDPRMPTLCGLRRRGYTPEAVKNFIDNIGVAKSNSVVDTALLEYFLREDLKTKCTRRMAVLDPIEVEITNYPEGKTEMFTVGNNAENPELGEREISFSRTVYIEREDFAIDPPPKFKRLYPGAEVRLMGAYIIKCTGYEQDEFGLVKKIICEYDPESKSGEGSRKVKGVLHWVDGTAQSAEVRFYESLVDQNGEINPDSLRVFKNSLVEASLKNAKPGEKFQFIRQGYFCADAETGEKLIFNRSVGLKDTWAKIMSK